MYSYKKESGVFVPLGDGVPTNHIMKFANGSMRILGEQDTSAKNIYYFIGEGKKIKNDSLTCIAYTATDDRGTSSEIHLYTNTRTKKQYVNVILFDDVNARFNYLVRPMK